METLGQDLRIGGWIFFGSDRVGEMFGDTSHRNESLPSYIQGIAVARGAKTTRLDGYARIPVPGESEPHQGTLMLIGVEGEEETFNVVAVEAGTVSFAGSVARVAYVVVLHDDGIRATYGRLEQIGVVTGQRVSAGQRLGTTTGRFYFGLRDGNTPVDPTPLIGRRTWPARLVPMDGTPARRVAPLGPVCPADARGNGRPGR